MNDSATPDTEQTTEYQVLARKYRPTTFSGLIGQEAMVRTLSNAFASNRLHHAFVMTGVRGVGKTSTARIIARALNCIGPDGNGGPTTEPCGVCEHCVAIAGDRHVDVLEMDAASNTGVDNIRELIEGVRYRAASARYKVYIVDEVHMLSKSAFNALLKTLEEPPEHVVFIFATTEIRKVPITVLSRCQRFDLRRVPVEKLVAHFADICVKEDAAVSDGALHVIARAADGSVRDGLSLLDQAIAHADGEVDEGRVRDMLGLADRTRTLDLLQAVMGGEIATALQDLQEQYNDGADPASVIEDLLELTHWLTKVRVMPETADGPDVPEHERTKGKELATTLRMPDLTRAWQLLLKGVAEVNMAPQPLSAAEMVLVRLAYAAELPTPGDAVKAIQDGTVSTPSAPSGAPDPGPTGGAQAHGGIAAAQPVASQAPAIDADPTPRAQAFANFEAVAAQAAQAREGQLSWFLENKVRVIHFAPGTLEINNTDIDKTMVQRLKSFLEEHTQMAWAIALSQEAGGPTLAEVKAQDQANERAAASDHPLVKAVLETFPGATVEDVRRVVTHDEAEIPGHESMPPNEDPDEDDVY